MKEIFSFLFAALITSCVTKTDKIEKSPIIREYIMDERDLVPEGIAYSEKNDVFYLTSIGKFKIIEVDRKTGLQKDFIKEHEFGFAPGAGIYVDDNRNLLYALGGYYMIKDSTSSLFTFDMTTKWLLKKYHVQDEGEHFLNDMIMDKSGNLYLTDTKDYSVYILKNDGDKLELFFKSPEIQYPNGIAISDDNTKLYIASISKGVRVLDILSKTILNQEDTLGVSQGIDGLEFYEGNLFGLQNSFGPNSFNFRKLILNDSQDKILRSEVIDSHTEKLDLPLTFCIMENKAVVIGNSNLQYLNQESFKFQESDTIKKTRLLVYEMD